jgi:hypothetical protein
MTNIPNPNDLEKLTRHVALLTGNDKAALENID